MPKRVVKGEMHQGVRTGTQSGTGIQLQQALELHGAGRLSEARALYERILAAEPRNAEALRFLGALNLAQGDVDEALRCLRQAIQAQPNNAEAHYGLGDAFQASGDLEAACASYRAALTLRPKFSEALCNLGNALVTLARRREAIAAFSAALAIEPRKSMLLVNLSIVHLLEHQPGEAIAFASKAVQLNPRDVEANYNLALAHEASGHAREALAAYRVAVAQRPTYASPYYRLGRLLQAGESHDEAAACFLGALKIEPTHADSVLELGVSLKALERWEDARRAFIRHTQLCPQSPEGWSNIGTTYQSEKRYEEAIAAYDKALALAPDSTVVLGNLSIAHFGAKHWMDAERFALRQISLDPEDCDGLNNLGLALAAQNRLEEAEAAFRRAIASHARSAQSHCNLGNLQFVRGDVASALASYRSAYECDPKLLPQVAWNEAIVMLLNGDYRAGWEKYEYRFFKRTLAERKRFSERRLPPNASVEGKTVLVYAEQGLGDTLQFIRYVPLLAARGATVHVEVQRPLLALLRQIPGAASVFAAGETVPPFDFQCPLLSLPHLFRTELATIPSPGSHVVASAERIEAWRSRLAVPGLKIGVVWAGNPHHEDDHNRSIAFATFRRLFATEGVHFFSLQKMRPPLEAQALRDEARVTDCADDLRDFMDTAAVMAQLDVVISVDTSVAHLAGAMGRPVWILLPHAPDWRWLAGRSDSPWYPSARLFRQTTRGDWESVLDAVIASIVQLRIQAAA